MQLKCEASQDPENNIATLSGQHQSLADNSALVLAHRQLQQSTANEVSVGRLATLQKPTAPSRDFYFTWKSHCGCGIQDAVISHMVCLSGRLSTNKVFATTQENLVLHIILPGAQVMTPRSRLRSLNGPTQQMCSVKCLPCI